jgi:hypothetical protein
LSQIYIHLCGQREQNMKNSYSFLQRHSYIRTTCSSIFTWATWTNYISPLPRRHTYCLSRIASSYDSSSYTHKIMFRLLPFNLLIFLRAFSCRDCNFFLSFNIDLSYLRWWCATIRQCLT